MAGQVVNATNLDSIRFEILGEGRAITIPATILLAADCVLRHCLTRDCFLLLDVPDGRSQQIWEAHLQPQQDREPDNLVVGTGITPWGAIVALANAIEARR